MRRILISIAFLIVGLSAASATAQVQKTREVIIATRRNHRVVVFDARSLAQLGQFIVSEGAETVRASPDGRTLFLQQPPPSEPNGCCALFSLDLATGSLCELVFPSSPGVMSPDGRLLFVQRGNVGVEVFDAKSLARLPVIKAPGGYSLYVSPDSRWLFGAQSWVDTSLDVFDLERREMVRRLALPAQRTPRGAWLGNRFYLYAHDGREGNLWQITPDTTELAAAKKIALPVPNRDGKAVYQQVVAAGDRLIAYEPLGWWLKSARRKEDAEMLGGLFSIDPATGAFEHLAPGTDFTLVVASEDGRNLYAIDAGTAAQTRPTTLLRLESKTGTILKKRDLARDVWNITVARLPESLIPRGRVWTTPCQNANAGVSK